MFLFLNWESPDAYDSGKKMEVIQDAETIMFRIKKDGNETLFHLNRGPELNNLIRFLKSFSNTNDSSSLYDYKKKKGFGICILNRNGEIEYGKQPNLPNPDIDSYDYDKLSALFQQEGVIYALFDVYEGVGEETVRKIIQYCVVSQANFIYRGDPIAAHKLTLRDVSKALGVDMAAVSRCTRHVRIYSPCGKIFTLDNKSLDLDKPSLFDEGIKNNGDVTRLEVLYEINKIREEMGAGKPLSDVEICIRLLQNGYDISRRTVTKYRNILDQKEKEIEKY